MGGHGCVVLEGQHAFTLRLWNNQMIAVRRTAVQSVKLTTEEGLCRSEFDTFGHCDTKVVRLMSFDNVVEFHRFGCVGTRVPPLHQAVGRLGQCQARYVIMDIVWRRHRRGA